MKCTQSICAIICLICFSNSLSAATPGDRAEEIAAIQTYCKYVDRFIKRNPKTLRIFANVASGIEPVPNWQQFKSEEEREQADTSENLNENAYVWTRQGKIIGANFTFQSGTRDWAHFAMYYYREDGSLAKIAAQLNTFHGHMSVVRERFYDRQGRLIASSKKYYDLETGKKRTPNEDFLDEPFPVYKRTTALPFYKPGSAGVSPA